MLTCLYTDRLSYCTHPLARQLLQIMVQKRSNLCVSADLLHSAEVLQLADQVGPYVCVFKTHVDILVDFTPKFTQSLTELAQKHQFLIFEDRKFADIGNTSALQYAHGIYRIADWAHITNAHILPGPGVIDGLRKAVGNKQRALLLLAEMSSQGNLLDANYARAAVKMAAEYADFVIGFVAQHRLEPDPRWLYFTPGIHQMTEGDHLGQQYHSPEAAIQQGSDILIVGRGIYAQPDPAQAAAAYQSLGWG